MDLKKGLAYSTVSQLGYMMLAMGCGAPVAGIFHLVTHAFFKAMLFLGSGSVIHAMEEVVGHEPVLAQDMRLMGGLRQKMPITSITFFIGCIAISGIPPLAGFWSKDEILGQAFNSYPLLWVVGFLTAGMTAFYMFRLYFLTFEGEFRGNDTAMQHQLMTAAGKVDDEHHPTAEACTSRPGRWRPLGGAGGAFRADRPAGHSLEQPFCGPSQSGRSPRDGRTVQLGRVSPPGGRIRGHLRCRHHHRCSGLCPTSD